MYTKKRDLKKYQSALSTRRIKCLLGLHSPKLFTLYGELGKVISKCNNLSEVFKVMEILYVSCDHCNKTTVRFNI